MMKSVILICLSLWSMILVAQKPVVIEYAMIEEFTWDLFKGKINKKHLDEMGHNTGAVTVSSLSYTTLQTSPTHAAVNITARFHPKESWTRYPNLKDEKAALKHEEGHLDITEIYARRIRKMVAEATFRSEDHKADLKTMFAAMAQKHADEQVRYDLETNHSINKEEQLVWDQWIADELSALQAYTDTEIKLKLTQ